MTAIPEIDMGGARGPVVESTLPLINIVFLLLIFFLVAGTLQSPMAKDVVAPRASVIFDEIEFSASDWIYADSYGRLSFAGAPIELADVGRALKDAHAVLLADGQLMGGDLAHILQAFEAAGGEGVMLVTERTAGQ